MGVKYEGGVIAEKKKDPYEDVEYYTNAIIKLYPTFRSENTAKDCLNVIKVAINNILKNPNEEKFKKIKMTNPTV